MPKTASTSGIEHQASSVSSIKHPRLARRHLHPRPAQELGLDAGGYPQGVGVPAIEVAPDGGDFAVACRQRLEGGGWLVVRSRSDSLLWVEGPGPEGGEALAAS